MIIDKYLLTIKILVGFRSVWAVTVAFVLILQIASFGIETNSFSIPQADAQPSSTTLTSFETATITTTRTATETATTTATLTQTQIIPITATATETATTTATLTFSDSTITITETATETATTTATLTQIQTIPITATATATATQTLTSTITATIIVVACLPLLQPVSVDSDCDGIFNNVDTLTSNFSNDFSDVALSGTTTGTITNRGSQELTVKEEPNPAGVRIKADASGGATGATVSVCGGAAVVTLNAGDEVVVTCSTVTIEVVGSSGTVEITFVADDGTTGTTDVGAGNSMTFDPESFNITADPGNPDTLVVLVDGEEISLAPGETIIVANVDIKPEAVPNPVNLKSNGLIPVAILTTDIFDATTLDVSTITFGPDEATAVQSAIEDVDSDGDDDIIFHFRTQETGIACGDTSATLMGETLNGDQVKGSDSIVTVGCS